MDIRTRASFDGSDIEDKEIALPVPDPFQSSWQLFYSAIIIRRAIVEQNVPSPWPPLASDLLESSILLPNELFNFLSWLLTGEGNSGMPSETRVEINEEIRRTVSSLGQDIQYAVEQGQYK